MSTREENSAENGSLNTLSPWKKKCSLGVRVRYTQSDDCPRNGVIDWQELGSSFALQMSCLAQCTCLFFFGYVFLPSEPLVSWHNSALVENCVALRSWVLQIHLFVSEMDFWILKPSHPSSLQPFSWAKRKFGFITQLHLSWLMSSYPELQDKTWWGREGGQILFSSIQHGNIREFFS